jgi:lysophospholipid acyltransferase (LPLAT)-like uncharacterized protein
MRLLNKTYKLNVVGMDNIKDNSIFAAWHNSTFVMFEANPFPDMVVLTADGTKGDIFTKAVERYGNKIIRVPYDENRKDSAAATRKMLDSLKEGSSMIIAVDGPKGPLYNVKPGIFYLAGKSGKKIVPVGVAASQKITAPLRWDKYFVPLPFSRVSVYLDNSYDNNDEESLRSAIFAATKKAEELLKS